MEQYYTLNEWLKMLKVKQLSEYKSNGEVMDLVKQNINKEVSFSELNKYFYKNGKNLLMYKDINFNDYTNVFLEQLSKGAFLTTMVNGKVNTMTISWGSIGIIWGKPSITVYVRYSRHTYKMLEKANEFTLNVPLSKNLQMELGFCGKESGRDYDKIKECNFTLVPSRTIDTPIIGECNLNYECKIMYKQSQEAGNILPNVKDMFYKTNDYHVAYTAEIVDSYLFEE